MGSILALPNDYTVVDLETTGLDPRIDSIIEISALRVRNGNVVSDFSRLVNITCELPAFISKLTGITAEMLEEAPSLECVIRDFSAFLGEDIIIGHNVGFDIRFLMSAYANHLGENMQNSYVDTMRIARRAIPGMQHYRLSDVSERLQVECSGAHRAERDCTITHECYQKMRHDILMRKTEEDFVQEGKKRASNPNDIRATTDSFDPDHPLFQKTVVFTGALSKMLRAEAMQMVVNCGGICGSGITKTTNYLVLGTSDYISAAEGKKTSKMIKAEKLQSDGYDIVTISEETFMDLVNYTST